MSEGGGESLGGGEGQGGEPFGRGHGYFASAGRADDIARALKRYRRLRAPDPKRRWWQFWRRHDRAGSA